MVTKYFRHVLISSSFRLFLQSSHFVYLFYFLLLAVKVICVLGHILLVNPSPASEVAFAISHQLPKVLLELDMGSSD